MALVIVATVGDASANSFVTLAEATTYMESRLNGGLWTAASTDDQNRALAEATRELSALSWQGLRTNATQALSWPRWWVWNPDGVNLAYNYYESAIVPQRVKDATCELAFQFINAGTTDVAALSSSDGVQQKVIGPLSTTYFDGGRQKSGLARYPRVMKLIGLLLTSSSFQTTLVRG